MGVIIPAYNEEARLGATLARCLQYLEGQEYQATITVVSDGSTDGTVALVRALQANHPNLHLIESKPNRGKGHVVRLGMLQVDAEWLLLSDADLATPIEEIEKLLPHCKKFPVIIGSRPLKESNLEIRQPLYRELLGRAFNAAVQTLGIRGIQDTQCGFKLFRQDAAREIFRRCALDGFGYDFESLMIARDLDLPIAEIPIRWRHQEGSKVRVLRDGTRMLRDLVALRLKGKRGRLAINEGRPE